MMGEKWRLLVQVWLMKNRALYLNVNVLRKKVPSRDIIFTRGRHFKNHACKGLFVCKAKKLPSFLSYFKTQSIGPALGIEPTTSGSAVKHPTD